MSDDLVITEDGYIGQIRPGLFEIGVKDGGSVLLMPAEKRNGEKSFPDHEGRPGEVGGSKPRGAAPNAEESELDRQIKMAEQTLYNWNNGVSAKEDKIEKAIVIGEDGTVLVEKIGGRSVIEFTDEEIAQTKDAYLLHNHPTGNGLSAEDIYTAAIQGMNKISAIGFTADGKPIVYSMSRKGSSWFSTIHATILDGANLNVFINKLNKSLFSKFQPMVAREELKPIEAERMHQSEMAKAIAEKFGWLYEERPL